MTLPPYASNPLGRDLVAAILSDPPEYRLIRDDWGTRDCPSYAGKVAGRLRRLHREWVERELDKLNRMFAISHEWDEARSRQILGTEDGNELIHRLLAEAREQRRAAA